MLPQSIQKAIDALTRLPGIGPKTASRLVFYLLKQSPQEGELIGEALRTLRHNLIFCNTCFNVAEYDPCKLCTDQDRDKKTICVVEQPLDIVALEKTDYRGTYHVLGGVLSPIDGIEAGDLKIKELIDRVKKGGIKEVILATNPSLEGEATALYIEQVFSKQAIKVRLSRIAHGLPMGGDLEYADAVTLGLALQGRQRIK